MKTNQGLIVLSDRAADHSRLRSVLDDWGYSEKEIQRFLSEQGPVRSSQVPPEQQLPYYPQKIDGQPIA
jgi:hypothetical protein